MINEVLEQTQEWRKERKGRWVLIELKDLDSGKAFLFWTSQLKLRDIEDLKETLEFRGINYSYTIVESENWT